MMRFFFRALLKRLFYKPFDIDELRQSHEQTAKLIGKPPKSIGLEEGQINEINVKWVSHKSAAAEKVILYLHGGGYVAGNLAMYHMLCGTLSEISGARVLMPEYRLAPEHPFPAALEDALSIYAWLLENGISPENIIIAGDSAGGGLTLATTLAIRDEGRPLPAGLICLSPWTDLTFSGASHETNAERSVILYPPNLRLWAEAYLAFADPRTPHISPAFADFKNFPPMLIQVGSDEVLLDDACMVAERAESAGVDATLSVYEGLWHVFQTAGTLLPNARKAFEEIGEFVKRIERESQRD